MARRKDHDKDTLQEMIITAAWQIVADEGFSAATARRIAGKVGYTPGTIYNIFPSLDDVHVHVSGRILDALFLALTLPEQDAEAGESHAETRLKALAMRYLAFARAHRHHWMMLFTHKLPEDMPTPPWLEEKICALFLPVEQALEPLFLSGGTQKTPDTQQDIEKSARTLWGAVHGLCYLQETGKLPSLCAGAQEKVSISTETLISHLIETFVAGCVVHHEGT